MSSKVSHSQLNPWDLGEIAINNTIMQIRRSIFSPLLVALSLIAVSTEALKANGGVFFQLTSSANKLAASLVIASTVLGMPSQLLQLAPPPAFAVEQEAIDRRRVMEQPVGAPEAAKKAIIKLPSG